MNDKEKQIEEMAKVIIKAGESYYKMPVDIECANREASELYEADYRKQSDTIRDFMKKLDKDWIEVTTKEYGTFYAVSEERIQELAKEYGVEVEE